MDAFLLVMDKRRDHFFDIYDLMDSEINTELGKLTPWDENVIAVCSGAI